jgi:hypothetical protein
VQVQVWQPTGSGSYTLLGSATLTVTDTRPAPVVSTIAPATIDLAAPPSTFTIGGSGFSTTGGAGLPVINFVRAGTLLAQSRTAALTPTSLTVPYPTSATALTPNLPGLSAGSVQVQVWQPTGGGSYVLIGSVGLTVSDSRPAPGVTGIAPAAIDLASPPASFTLTGGGFENLGFGLPVVNFVRAGALLAQARATGATATSLIVPFPTPATSLTPNLPGLSPGPVEVQVWVQIGAGAYRLLGTASLSVQ